MKYKSIILKHKGIVLILIGTTLLYLLNYYTPLYADDYNYAFSFATGKRLRELSEIIPSMGAHYYHMNGRLVLHAIAQAFLLLGKPYFNIINAMVFMALLVLVGYHAYGSIKRIRLDGIFVAFILIWWCAPEFGQSFLWVTGASNYLYGILIILVFLIPYREYLEYERNKVSKVSEIVFVFIMGIFGIIAGWINENMSVALIMIEIGLVCAYRVQQKPLKLWMFSGIIGTLIGCVIMLTAPAQSMRLEAAGGMGDLKSS